MIDGVLQISNTVAKPAVARRAQQLRFAPLEGSNDRHKASGEGDLHGYKFFVGTKKPVKMTSNSLPFTVALSEAENDISIHVFDAELAMQHWVRQTKHRDHYERVHDKETNAQRAENNDHTRHKKVQKSRLKWMQDEYDSLARGHWVETIRPIRRATEDADPVEVSTIQLDVAVGGFTSERKRLDGNGCAVGGSCVVRVE